MYVCVLFKNVTIQDFEQIRNRDIFARSGGFFFCVLVNPFSTALPTRGKKHWDLFYIGMHFFRG